MICLVMKQNGGVHVLRRIQSTTILPLPSKFPTFFDTLIWSEHYTRFSLTHTHTHIYMNRSTQVNIKHTTYSVQCSQSVCTRIESFGNKQNGTSFKNYDGFYCTARNTEWIKCLNVPFSHSLIMRLPL